MSDLPRRAVELALKGYRDGLEESPNGETEAADKASSEPTEARSPCFGHKTILEHFRASYRPIMRKGTAIVTGDGREVQMREGISVPNTAIIQMLANAVDAPRFKGGGLNWNALPGFFNKWARVAWGDLLQSLPSEDDAGLTSDSPVGEEFRRLVSAALFTQVVLGDTIGREGDPTRIERRSLIDWCARFAKEGPWRSIRSYRVWCKRELASGGELVLKVALRHELFAQVKADRGLCEMGAKVFTRRAARYAVGRSTTSDRPHGLSALVLDRAFVAELVASLPDDAGEADREID